MIVLVTGGAGFIGRHLVRLLLATPGVSTVRVLDNLFRPCPAPGDLLDDPLVCDRRVRFLKGDIRDAQTVREAMSGAELVFHLAAQSNVLGSVTDLDYSFSTNVAGTLNLLEAARASGTVRRLVFASSREVYGEPDELPVAETAPLAPKNAYGASKMAAEAYCGAFAAQGLGVSVVRMANVYGPGDRDRVIPLFCGRALAGEPLLLYGGGQVIDFVPVGLTCEALLRAAERELPGPVNIGSGQGTTLQELAARVAACLPGRGVETSLLPPRGPEVVRFVASAERMRDWLGLAPPSDPLAELPGVLAFMREQGA
ncbi:MAG: NAD-dependent epimerase/dehydratase family protein [Desulfovibrio sp.]